MKYCFIICFVLVTQVICPSTAAAINIDKVLGSHEFDSACKRAFAACVPKHKKICLRLRDPNDVEGVFEYMVVFNQCDFGKLTCSQGIEFVEVPMENCDQEKNNDIADGNHVMTARNLLVPLTAPALLRQKRQVYMAEDTEHKDLRTFHSRQQSLLAHKKKTPSLQKILKNHGDEKDKRLITKTFNNKGVNYEEDQLSSRETNQIMPLGHMQVKPSGVSSIETDEIKRRNVLLYKKGRFYKIIQREKPNRRGVIGNAWQAVKDVGAAAADAVGQSANIVGGYIRSEESLTIKKRKEEEEKKKKKQEAQWKKEMDEKLDLKAWRKKKKKYLVTESSSSSSSSSELDKKKKKHKHSTESSSVEEKKKRKKKEKQVSEAESSKEKTKKKKKEVEESEEKPKKKKKKEKEETSEEKPKKKKKKVEESSDEKPKKKKKEVEESSGETPKKKKKKDEDSSEDKPKKKKKDEESSEDKPKKKKKKEEESTEEKPKKKKKKDEDSSEDKPKKKKKKEEESTEDKPKKKKKDEDSSEDKPKKKKKKDVSEQELSAESKKKKVPASAEDESNTQKKKKKKTEDDEDEPKERHRLHHELKVEEQDSVFKKSEAWAGCGDGDMEIVGNSKENPDGTNTDGNGQDKIRQQKYNGCAIARRTGDDPKLKILKVRNKRNAIFRPNSIEKESKKNITDKSQKSAAKGNTKLTKQTTSASNNAKSTQKNVAHSYIKKSVKKTNAVSKAKSPAKKTGDLRKPKTAKKIGTLNKVKSPVKRLGNQMSTRRPGLTIPMNLKKNGLGKKNHVHKKKRRRHSRRSGKNGRRSGTGSLATGRRKHKPNFVARRNGSRFIKRRARDGRRNKDNGEGKIREDEKGYAGGKRRGGGRDCGGIAGGRAGGGGITDCTKPTTSVFSTSSSDEEIDCALDKSGCGSDYSVSSEEREKFCKLINNTIVCTNKDYSISTVESSGSSDERNNCALNRTGCGSEYSVSSEEHIKPCKTKDGRIICSNGDYSISSAENDSKCKIVNSTEDCGNEDYSRSKGDGKNSTESGGLPNPDDPKCKIINEAKDCGNEDYSISSAESGLPNPDDPKCKIINEAKDCGNEDYSESSDDITNRCKVNDKEMNCGNSDYSKTIENKPHFVKLGNSKKKNKRKKKAANKLLGSKKYHDNDYRTEDKGKSGNKHDCPLGKK